MMRRSFRVGRKAMVLLRCMGKILRECMVQTKHMKMSLELDLIAFIISKYQSKEILIVGNGVL